MQTLILALLLIAGATQNTFAKPAENSIYTVSVERIFSARPRTMGYRYLVQITCRSANDAFSNAPVKNSAFSWKAGKNSYSSVTDNQGRAEFTQTAYDGNLNDTLEIQFMKQQLVFTSPKGVHEVPVAGPCLNDKM
ncbi:hypothetical protein [Bdellovibrio sp. HCB209]|uniref:hypothetical protein n=1 Tax=Bdellovibrio sp. HCB209 TaxID=3394354 RepID=UPI0039B3E027